MIRSVELIPPAEQEQRVGYPWDLPAIEALAEGLALHPRVTYLIGENDNGKSTLLESIALAAAMNAEGDLRTSPFRHRLPRDLWRARLIRGSRRTQDRLFLRAESLFTAATYLEELSEIGKDPLLPMGVGRYTRCACGAESDGDESYV